MIIKITESKSIKESANNKEFLKIDGFEHAITDTFEDEGYTGCNVVYTWHEKDIVEVEIWDQNDPVRVIDNLYAPNMMQSRYDDFDDFANDLQYKITRYIRESKSAVTEAANPENADLNMKIAKTLATKLTKEPKYRADLEAAGFELYDSDWSTYKNWAVKGPNGKSVVLSKGYDNKPRIYNSANSLATKDAINVFDFVNYLTMDFTDRHDYRAHGGIGRTNSDNVYIKNKDGSAIDADFSPKTKTQQYHDLQKSIKDAKWDIDYYSREIDRIHTQIAQLQKDADRYLDSKSMSKDKLMTKLAEIDTLLKSMGVRSAEESLKMRIKESDDYIDSPKYIADRYLDFDIPDMCADTLKVLDNMSESTLAELISACRTFYNTLDEICTLHS